MTTAQKPASTFMVVLAFATVYLVWGSTYFFIQKAIHDLPALLLGAIRFLASGFIMLAWCIYKKERLWHWPQVKPALITGLLLLFIGNGAVIWAEKSLASSLVAVLVSAAPIWFVLLDKPKWKENLTNRKTILGLVIGFIGVILLFSEQTAKVLNGSGSSYQVLGLLILLIGSLSWAGGSLFSKYNSSGSSTVNTTWQMLAAGFVFLPSSFIGNEWNGFEWNTVSTGAWLSVLYLIFFGSLAGYSAYVWLLKVRPATQVSTYAYVNPVVAVLLGVFLAGEKMSVLQLTGLAVILTSVLLINLSKSKKVKKEVKPALVTEMIPKEKAC